MRPRSRSWSTGGSPTGSTASAVQSAATPFRPTGVPVVDAYLSHLDATGRLTSCSTEPHDLEVMCRVVGRGAARRVVQESLAAFGDRDVGWYIEQLFRPRRGRRLALSTVYRRLVAAARFFEWAVTSDLFPRNPFPPERAVVRQTDARPCRRKRETPRGALRRRARGPPG